MGWENVATTGSVRGKNSLQNTTIGWWMCECVCECVRVRVRVCESESEGVRVCVSVWEWEWGCEGVCECVWVCERVRVCDDSEQVHRNGKSTLPQWMMHACIHVHLKWHITELIPPSLPPPPPYIILRTVIHRIFFSQWTLQWQCSSQYLHTMGAKHIPLGIELSLSI